MILRLITKFTKILCRENLGLYSIYIVLLRKDVPPYKPKRDSHKCKPLHMASDQEINVNAPCDEGYHASLYA